MSVLVLALGVAPLMAVAGDAPSPPDDPYENGVALARRFAACRRDRVEYKRLETSTSMPTGPAWTAQQVYAFRAQVGRRANATDVLYVRNQKVASQWFLIGCGLSAVADHQSKVHSCIDTPSCYASFAHTRESLWTGGKRRGDADCETHGFSGKKSFGFTFVREPITTFISGFLEVLCRPSKYEKGKKPLGSSLTMPRDDVHAVLAQYLRDVAAGAYLGGASMHTWPQSYRIDTSVTLDFIGKAETLIPSYTHLFPSHRSIPPPSHPANESSCKGELMESLDLDSRPDIVRELCNILAVDFRCLDYEPPPACAHPGRRKKRK